jgi:uncharacterized SAM-binding protein YcdF (DUF218 family)
MFLVKKIITKLILPLSVCTELLFIGVVLLWFTRKQKAGKFFVTLALFLLVLVSFRTLPYYLLRPLENQYPPLNVDARNTAMLSNIKWVVVLSGGHSANRQLPLSSRISNMSLTRLVEGIRLFKYYQGSKLILSGGDYFDSTSDAEIMFQMAKVLSVHDNDMLIEKESKDTEDQARLVQHMVGNERFILVTSASHMVRAVGLFRKEGMNPIPAPTDYLMKTEGSTANNFYPNEEALYQTKTAVYEYMGILWAKMRGKM